MSRDGGDRAPPMRKGVRAARLTLTHASGLRYALGDRRGRPLSRPSSRPSAFGHPRPVNGTALSTSPQTSSTRGGFPRFRDAPDHGLPPPPAAFDGPSRYRERTGASRAEARASPASARAHRALDPKHDVFDSSEAPRKKRLCVKKRESRVASTRRLTTTLSPFLTHMTDFSCT